MNLEKGRKAMTTQRCIKMEIYSAQNWIGKMGGLSGGPRDPDLILFGLG